MRSPAPRRSSTTQSGTEAINSAAKLDGTVFSATETTALAPGSKSPTKPAASSSARVGRKTEAPRLRPGSAAG